MIATLANFMPVAEERPPYEFVFLGVAVLLTLALLVGFIALMVRQRREK